MQVIKDISKTEVQHNDGALIGGRTWDTCVLFHWTLLQKIILHLCSTMPLGKETVKKVGGNGLAISISNYNNAFPKSP